MFWRFRAASDRTERTSYRPPHAVRGRNSRRRFREFSRRVSPLRCLIESAMPRLVMVRAWWGPFRQSFRSGSCSSEDLFPSRRSFGSLRRTRQQQNTAFRRRTSGRFQNRRWKPVKGPEVETTTVSCGATKRPCGICCRSAFRQSYKEIRGNRV